MKRQLLVTLVASALELYAGSIAQAACLANGATPIRSGPLNPVDGFPEYVTDSTGLSVQRCLDPAFCFFDPIVQEDPFSVQINSGGEAFYWAATAVLNDASGNGKLTLVMAAETAFLEANPVNEAPIDGSQFPFLRLRLVFKAPAAGNYTLVHPYGTETFTVDVASGGRDVFNTIDAGFAPNSTVNGPVGPFLVWDTGAPTGYVGNGSLTTGVPHKVKGSPCNVNSVTLTGTDLQGNPLDLDGNGGNVLTTDLFDVQGQIWDGRAQTPLTPSRLTYSRAAGQLGQIDAFAASTNTATVTVKDGPTIAAGSSRVPTAVTLGHALSAQGGSINSTRIAVGGPDTDALPKVLAVTATDAGATQPTQPTDPTTLIHSLVDFVKISQADYDPVTHQLLVKATSGDERVAPALTVLGYGVAPGTVISTQAPPASVTVSSSAGGSDTAWVRVVTATAPSAPTGLVGTAPSASSVTLSWTDTSGNEDSFDIFRGPANGPTVKIASVGANATSFTDTGLSASTAYDYQVFAVNTNGSAGSNVTAVTTLAPLLAPSGASAAANPARTVTLNWTDNSNDETGFRVLRSSAAAGPFVQVATAAANTGTAADTTAAPNTTYFYQVVAVRGTEPSTATAVSLTTPALPSAPTALSTAATTAGTTAGTQVTLNWADANTNESGFQVYRRVGTGAFAAVGPVLPANTTQFIDTTTLPGTAYSYRVDVSNWAGTTASAASATLTTPNPQGGATLNAPTSLVASGNITLNWVDASTSETGYRWQRITVTANSTTGVVTTTAGAVNSLGANARTATSGSTDRTLYQFDVWAVNGATLGPKAAVLRYSGVTGTRGVLPTQSISSTAVSPIVTGSTTRNVTVNWAANTSTAVTGYELQRCTGTATACATSSAWGTILTRAGRRTTTQSHVDTALPRGATYSYRIRPTLPLGLQANYSATVSRTVN